MSNDLKQAAQQALGALRKSVGAMRGLYGGWRCEAPLKAADAAIHALEAALEQPDQSKGEHMTRDDITRMAREAGFSDKQSEVYFDRVLQRFAAIVAAAEREACAKVCEQADEDGEGPDCWGWHSKDYAAAIRARTP